MSSEPETPGMLRTLMRMSRKKAEERRSSSNVVRADETNEPVEIADDATLTTATSHEETSGRARVALPGRPDGVLGDELTVVLTQSPTADDLRHLFGGSRVSAKCVMPSPIVPTHGNPRYDASADAANGGYETAEPLPLAWRLPFLHARKIVTDETESQTRLLQKLLHSVTTEFVLISPELEALELKGVNDLLSRVTHEQVLFGSGNIRHVAETGNNSSPLLAPTHKRAQVIDFYENEAFGDFGLGNKIFRTTFLREVVDFCVERNLDELIQTSLVASAWAKEYLVSKEIVLSTFFPTENAAVRRQRNNPDVLASTMSMIEHGIDALVAVGDEELINGWRIYSFGALMSPYYQLVPRASAEYWNTLSEFIDGQYASIQRDGILDSLSLHDRVLIHLIKENNRADCEAVSFNRSELGSKYLIEVSDGHLFAAPNYLEDLQSPIPKDILACQESELQLKAGIFDYQWTDPSVLRISGYAYIEGLDIDIHDQRTCVRVVNTITGAFTDFPIRSVDNPRIDSISNDRNLSYAAMGFESDIALSQFPDANFDSLLGSYTWKIEVLIENKAGTVQDGFAWRDRSGSAANLDFAELQSGVRLVPRFSSDEGLEVKFDRPKYVVHNADIEGRVLTIRIAAGGGSIPIGIEASCSATKTTTQGALVAFDDGVATYSVELPTVTHDSRAKGEWDWSIRAVLAGNEYHPLSWAYDAKALEARIDPAASLTVRLTGFGYVKLVERRWRILVDRVVVSSDGQQLEVFGSCDLDSGRPPILVLSNARGSITATYSELVAKSDKPAAEFRVKFDLKASVWRETEGPIESGAYSLRYLRHEGDDPSRSHWILAGRRFSNELPYRAEGYRASVEVSRTTRQGAVKIHVRPNLSEREASRFGQRELQLEYFTGPNVDLSVEADGEFVLATCFGGRRVTDTVLEVVNRLHKEKPDLPIYWGVVDESVPVPEGHESVVIGTRRWYQLLSSARLLINNNNFPHYYRKRAGQYYLQTWHGTPLKRLVFDVDSNNFSLSYWALMAREAKYWDLLIGQNEASAKTLANAFRYDGPLFYDGYPRNDSLNGPDALATREKVRRHLGIGTEEKVVLYAPTWRDNAKSSSSQYAMVTYLDFDAFNKQLGKEWTVLLRGHHNIAAGRTTAGLNVVDVTDYPLVNDLYLAADALVTDYSSVMFDFSVTGKQIVYLAPDIDAYRDDIRGFYFDLIEAAPGPVVKTTRGVVDALQNLTLTQWRYLRKRKEFKHRFAPFDDGAATNRLYEALPISEIFRGE